MPRQSRRGPGLDGLLHRPDRHRTRAVRLGAARASTPTSRPCGDHAASDGRVDGALAPRACGLSLVLSWRANPSLPSERRAHATARSHADGRARRRVPRSWWTSPSVRAARRLTRCRVERHTLNCASETGKGVSGARTSKRLHRQRCRGLGLPRTLSLGCRGGSARLPRNGRRGLAQAQQQQTARTRRLACFAGHPERLHHEFSRGPSHSRTAPCARARLFKHADGSDVQREIGRLASGRSGPDGMMIRGHG